MKKYFLLIALISCIAAFAQIKETYRIGILLDSRADKSEQLLLGLKSEIKAVIGEDAEIIFPDEMLLANDFDVARAAQNYNKLIAGNADIILAFGQVNNVVLSKIETFLKPTILFGSVNKDFDLFDLDKSTVSISNFTYLVIPHSFKKDLSALKALTKFSKVGIAVEEGLMDVLPFNELFDKETKELGVAYQLIPYKTGLDIINLIDKDIDAFYLASGFFLTGSEIKQIAAKLIEEKIPSFTNTLMEDVENGFMATYNSEDNIEQYFRRIALNVESYVTGESNTKSIVAVDLDQALTLNKNTVERVGIALKYSLIANTNFVGDFSDIPSEKKYNLLEVMQTVIDENLSLKASTKDIRLREQDVKSSKSNYYPSVVASASGTYIDPKLAQVSLGQAPEFSTAGAISLDQTLFSEAANANITIQKELLSAQKENFNAQELDAILDVSTVYFNALILKANLQIQNQNLNLTKKNLQIAKQNYEAGQSGKADVLRFRSESAQNTQTLIEARNQLDQTFFVMNQLLNNPIDFAINVDDAELGEGILENYNYQALSDLLDDPKLREPFVEYLIKTAKENSPEIKSLDYTLKANTRSIKQFGIGRLIPTIGLRAQYNNEFSRSGEGVDFPAPGVPLDDYFVGASLSLPILNRTQTNINRQTAIIQEDQLTINKDNTALAIEGNINSAVLNLMNQIANIEISKISETAAKESLELTQVSYANGAVAIVQLLDAQNNYLVAQQAKITAVYNYLLNLIQLERFISYYFLLHTAEENQTFIEGFTTYLQNRN